MFCRIFKWPIKTDQRLFFKKNLLCLPLSLSILWYFTQKFSFPPESRLLSTLPGVGNVSVLSPENKQRQTKN